MFWWRDGFNGSEELQPQLAMRGKRLDGPAVEASSGPPATNAYNVAFHWAMLLGFQVEAPGCWEITGSYGEYELNFVVWIAP